MEGYLIRTRTGFKGPFTVSQLQQLVDLGRVPRGLKIYTLGRRQPVIIDEVLAGDAIVPGKGTGGHRPPPMPEQSRRTPPPGRRPPTRRHRTAPVPRRGASTARSSRFSRAKRKASNRVTLISGSVIFILVGISVAIFAYKVIKQSTLVEQPTLIIKKVPPKARNNPSPAEVERASRAFVEALNLADNSAIEALIDMQALSERVWSGIDTSSSQVRSMKKGYNDKLKEPGNLTKKMFPGIEGGLATFLRVYTVRGEIHGLVRLNLVDGSLNYFDLLIDKAENGVLRIGDFYSFGSGEYLSETTKRLLIFSAAQLNQGIVGQALGKPQQLLEDIKNMQNVITLSRKEQYMKAMEAFNKLSPNFRKIKAIQLLHIGIASSIDEKKYLDSIDEFEGLFKRDPALDLILIDRYFLQQKYTEAIAVIDRLDQRVKGDPYLESLRGYMYFHRGDHEKARAAFKQTMNQDPTIEDAYWGLIELALLEKNFDRVAALLTAVERDANIGIGDLTEIQEYAEFVKSDAYKKWYASRQQAPAPQEP